MVGVTASWSIKRPTVCSPAVGTWSGPSASTSADATSWRDPLVEVTDDDVETGDGGRAHRWPQGCTELEVLSPHCGIPTTCSHASITPRNAHRQHRHREPFEINDTTKGVGASFHALDPRRARPGDHLPPVALRRVSLRSPGIVSPRWEHLRPSTTPSRRWPTTPQVLLAAVPARAGLSEAACRESRLGWADLDVGKNQPGDAARLGVHLAKFGTDRKGVLRIALRHDHQPADELCELPTANVAN